MQRKRLLLIGILLVTCAGLAENGADGWLRYARLDSRTASRYASLPATLVVLDHSAVSQSAQTELLHGIRGMLGRDLRIADGITKEAALLLGKAGPVGGRAAGVPPPT